MRSSCRFAVAVHILAVMAYQEGDRLSSRQMAGSVNTNPVIIRRLLLVLKRARLIETSLGPGAGSRLSRSPRRITLGDVYRAVEKDDPFPTPRKKPDAACPIGSTIQKSLAEIFAAAKAALERELEKTTVAELVTMSLRPHKRKAIGTGLTISRK